MKVSVKKLEYELNNVQSAVEVFCDSDTGLFFLMIPEEVILNPIILQSVDLLKVEKMFAERVEEAVQKSEEVKADIDDKLEIYTPERFKRRQQHRDLDSYISVSDNGVVRFSVGASHSLGLGISSKVEFVRFEGVWYLGMGVGFALVRTSGGAVLQFCSRDLVRVFLDEFKKEKFRFKISLEEKILQGYDGVLHRLEFSDTYTEKPVLKAVDGRRLKKSKRDRISLGSTTGQITISEYFRKGNNLENGSIVSFAFKRGRVYIQAGEVKGANIFPAKHYADVPGLKIFSMGLIKKVLDVYVLSAPGTFIFDILQDGELKFVKSKYSKDRD